MATCFLPLLAAALLLGASPAYPPPDVSATDARPYIAKPAWRLYAVEYARSDRVAVRRLVAGGPRGARVDMSWHFYVAVGHGRVVTIDAGSDHFAKGGYLKRKWSIARSRTVAASLAQLGLKPVDVSDAVLTHAHWDHVGGVGSFLKARVHMLPREWRQVHKRLRKAVEARKGFMGVGALPPGIRVTEAGRHTAHHAIVDVACGKQSPVVIAGDGAYLWDNLRLSKPVTQTTDGRANVRDMAAAVKRVGLDRVLPGHDPALFARFPSGVDGVALICP